MATFLFNELIFGPVKSRRLGISLGINLLPTNNKYCTFNCIYCECGWTDIKGNNIVLPKRDEIKQKLAAKLKDLQGTENEPDAITFAGNGEPTIHPDFSAIIDDTIEARNQYAPKAKISVLSNASQLHKQRVKEALTKVDKNIQKLDAGTNEMFQRINQPLGKLSLSQIVDKLLSFEGKLIIQTLFIKGTYKGERIDNTSEEELSEWLEIVKKVNPEYVMIYPIDRDTPAKDLEKIPAEKMDAIAKRVNEAGIKTEVYY
jgi:wyosine [tRNA(Phe)-imidazoG37] synthetase (radical SAM superfamily)